MRDQKLCFVVGPIGKAGSDARLHADWLLKGIIKPVFKQHFPDYAVVRADEIVQPGNISSQVINRLFDAHLVIADMSLANANAFYELAIRHMKCLPTIHMIRVGEEIPFDVFPYRAVHFSYHDPADIDTAQAELRSVIEETIKLGLVIENPITHARGVIDFQEHATEAQKLILDELHTLRQRVSTVEAIASTISKNVAPVLEREAMVRALASRPSNAAFGTLHEFSVPPLPLAASNAPQSVQITTASDKSD